MEKILNTDSIELNDENDIKNVLKDVQKEDKRFGINFKNLGEYKNTIEIRLANGTLDADTWIENINLFGGLVRASQELAIIQTKPEEERTNEENEKLEYFEQIKTTEISEKEKLEALLKIVVSEDIRNIYLERYNTNSKLINENTEIEEAITKGIAKTPIKVKKIGKSVFVGSNAITGQEYEQSSQIIERDLQNSNDNRSIE